MQHFIIAIRDVTCCNQPVNAPTEPRRESFFRYRSIPGPVAATATATVAVTATATVAVTATATATVYSSRFGFRLAPGLPIPPSPRMAFFSSSSSRRMAAS